MKRTKEDANQTREDILNAAIHVFLQKTVARTTLDEIARAANVTRGAVYWHFKNKTEIFDALHERLYSPFFEMVMADMQKDHPNPLEQLRDLCVQLFLDLEDNEPKRQSLSLFLLKCDYSGELACCKEKHLAKKERSLELFCRYFEKAQEVGALPAHATPKLFTLSIHCYILGVLFEYLDDPEGFNIRKKAPALMDLFFVNMGLLPHPSCQLKP